MKMKAQMTWAIGFENWNGKWEWYKIFTPIYTKNMAIKDFTRGNPVHIQTFQAWKQCYRQGYRCIQVRIVPVIPAKKDYPRPDEDGAL